MSSYQNQVATILHHDMEVQYEVRGHEAPDTYIRNVTYFIPKSHIELIKSLSVSCHQYVMVDCVGAESLGRGSWWKDIDGDKHPFFNDPEFADPNGCKCDIVGPDCR